MQLYYIRLKKVLTIKRDGTSEKEKVFSLINKINVFN